MTESPILPPGPPHFPFAWESDDDAALSWEWDSMHAPAPLAPLAADYMRAIAQGFAYRYESFDIPMEIVARVWNGYPYFAARLDGPEDEVVAKLTTRKREFIASAHAYWTERALPELRTAYAAMDDVRPDQLDGAALADAWEASWQSLERAWRIHFKAISAAYQVLEDLADRYEALVPDAPAGEALRLIQAGVDELQAVGDGIEHLVDLARQDPDLSSRLRGGQHDPPATGAFADALAGFLGQHGHLGQGWDNLQLPSWAEAPQQLMAEIAKQLERPAERAASRRARLTADGERLHAALRERLADRPAELEEFEALLASAALVGPITETHNYWIDRMAQATVRRLAARVARRLMADGVLAVEDDIFYLNRAEVAEVLRAPRDMTSAVAQRRGEHERQRSITPPAWVGQPPGEAAGRFDAPEARRTQEDELRGAGASAGIVRGPARLVLDQGDFGKVQAGDVIFCLSSNPSWVPLFSIAGGLVTDTGGVLSHAAVVAREFGLPAVVGTRDGTKRVADGRPVEVDGSAGIVRLL